MVPAQATYPFPAAARGELVARSPLPAEPAEPPERDLVLDRVRERLRESIGTANSWALLRSLPEAPAAAARAAPPPGLPSLARDNTIAFSCSALVLAVEVAAAGYAGAAPPSAWPSGGSVACDAATRCIIELSRASVLVVVDLAPAPRTVPGLSGRPCVAARREGGTMPPHDSHLLELEAVPRPPLFLLRALSHSVITKDRHSQSPGRRHHPRPTRAANPSRRARL